MSAWDDRGARRVLAEMKSKPKRTLAQAEANAQAGPCPNCGAPAEVDLIDVSTRVDELFFVPGVANCSARCYEADPEAYLRAVNAR